MNDFPNPLFDVIDSNEPTTNDLFEQKEFQPVIDSNTFDSSYRVGNETVFQHHDPLACANKFHMEPLKLHHVKPHYVHGYVRDDGTVVNGYMRDGEGNGYLRSNHDDILDNNLNE